MEYLEADVDCILKNNMIINEVTIAKIIYNLLCNLAYMHMLGVMHRDVKPANILLNTDIEVKICDLGLSRCIPFQKDDHYDKSNDAAATNSIGLNKYSK